MKRLALFLPFLVLLLLTGCSGPVKPKPTPTGASDHTIKVGALDRTYRVFRPTLTAGKPVPLVVVLHGAAGTGRQAEMSYDWDDEAITGGFVAAFPDGIKRTWNASPDCCGVAARDQVDDVAFITAMIAEIGRQSPIDPARVYATGISNGALLTYRLACETTLFAAIAPVAGTMINPCPAPRPLSVLAIHGKDDQTIPYGGGAGRRDNAGSGRLPVKIDGPGVEALSATWRKTDNCPAPAVTSSEMLTTTIAHCPGGRTVELIAVAGAGHQWPGSRGPGPIASRLLQLDPPSMAIDATDTIWRFFDAP
ncbi:PHB depolymerase family esterase [Actinoplanes sp. NPDC026619]|uniref:extracellular catalytic domain type 1 short-chain-length polyhydroxyalkanoate depolymerase n=1 Tax=Actinoplanes sp. NPDC026619 TaxID=3155798 RepID=UPI0033C10FBB